MNRVVNICLRRKRKRRDATGKLDYDRPADYNLPLVPHPPGNCTVSKSTTFSFCSSVLQIQNSANQEQPSTSTAGQIMNGAQADQSTHRGETTTPLTAGGTGALPLTPGAITAAVKTELNLIPKSELDARSTPHPDVSLFLSF